MLHIGCQQVKQKQTKQQCCLLDSVSLSLGKISVPFPWFQLNQVDNDTMIFYANMDIICKWPVSNAVCLCPRDSITQVQREKEGRMGSVTFGHEITSHRPSWEMAPSYVSMAEIVNDATMRSQDV